MKDTMESYLVPYTSKTLDYNAIQVMILNSVDWMGFLTILSDDQVVLLYSLGLFSSGLGLQTPAHCRIFVLFSKKVGRELATTIMALVAGLVPWFRVKEHLEPDTANLAPLESRTAWTIPVSAPPLRRRMTGNVWCRTPVSFPRHGPPTSWLP
jgi:hypothetical protein